MKNRKWIALLAAVAMLSTQTVFKRADKAMYERKKQMKAQQVMSS